MKKGIIVAVDATDPTRGSLADGIYVFSNKNVGALAVGNAITYEMVKQTRTYQRDENGEIVVDAAGKKVLIGIPVDDQREVAQVRAVFADAATMSQKLAESAGLDLLIAMEAKASVAGNAAKLAEKYKVDVNAFA